MSEKYKMFRNYMANEIGITREDIKEWTKEAVKEVAERQVAQINIQGIVTGVYKNQEWSIRESLKHEVARQIADKIKINFGDA